MKRVTHPICIIGQGLVAWTLANALRELGLDVALISEQAPSTTPTTAYRGIALAKGSLDLLQAWGMGTVLTSLPQGTIETIHVSAQGHPHTMQLDAKPMGHVVFGQVVNAIDFQKALHAHWQQAPCPHYPCHITSFTRQNGNILLNSTTHTVTTRLVVICDGQQSDWLARLGLHQQRDDYQQCAHATTVTRRGGQPHIAYERFLPSGPLALLPTHDPQRMAMVWTMPNDAEVNDWCKALQQAMGYRAGTFIDCETPVSFPLQRLRTRPLAQAGFILMGNSASLYHPAAGQGLNLAMRDIAALRTLLEQHQASPQAHTLDQVWQAYQHTRIDDHTHIAQATHAIAKWFNKQDWNLAGLGSLGLLGMDALPYVKRWLATRAMGYHHSGATS